MVGTGYCVGDTMTTRPVTVRSSDTVCDAAHTMREHDVGSVIVRDADDLLGIVTEWDFVHRVVAAHRDVNETLVRDIMVRDLVTVHPSMDVFDALRLMRDADVRHLPVLEGGSLVGFVTMKDILRLQPQLFEIITEKYALRGGEEEEF